MIAVTPFAARLARLTPAPPPPGLSGVLVTLAGYIGSGIVIKLLRPRPVFVTGYSALVSGVQTCCMFALMAVRCPEAPMHGTVGESGQ